MKIKDKFLLSKVAEEYILIPLGETAKNYNVLVRMNESAAFIIQQLKTGTSTEQIVDAFLGEYDVSREKAEADVKQILDQLRGVEALED